MLPAVAEVVEVAQRLGAEVLEHVDEPRLASVERAIAPIGIGNASADVAGAQLVERRVGPADGGVEAEVKTIEPDGKRRH
jgi:hypothetical protein